jgi:hypothetical protein
MLHVNQAKYLTDYRVWLSFDNGVSGEIDLLPELWGGMFEPLKDKALFSTVRLDTTLKTITWQNGADFAPEFLLELLEQELHVEHTILGE